MLPRFFPSRPEERLLSARCYFSSESANGFIAYCSDAVRQQNGRDVYSVIRSASHERSVKKRVRMRGSQLQYIIRIIIGSSFMFPNKVLCDIGFAVIMININDNNINNCDVCRRCNRFLDYNRHTVIGMSIVAV